MPDTWHDAMAQLDAKLLANGIMWGKPSTPCSLKLSTGINEPFCKLDVNMLWMKMEHFQSDKRMPLRGGHFGSKINPLQWRNDFNFPLLPCRDPGCSPLKPRAWPWPPWRPSSSTTSCNLRYGRASSSRLGILGTISNFWERCLLRWSEQRSREPGCRMAAPSLQCRHHMWGWSMASPGVSCTLWLEGTGTDGRTPHRSQTTRHLHPLLLNLKWRWTGSWRWPTCWIRGTTGTLLSKAKTWRRGGIRTTYKPWAAGQRRRRNPP